MRIVGLLCVKFLQILSNRTHGVQDFSELQPCNLHFWYIFRGIPKFAEKYEKSPVFFPKYIDKLLTM